MFLRHGDGGFETFRVDGVSSVPQIFYVAVQMVDRLLPHLDSVEQSHLEGDMSDEGNAFFVRGHGHGVVFFAGEPRKHLQIIPSLGHLLPYALVGLFGRGNGASAESRACEIQRRAKEASVRRGVLQCQLARFSKQAAYGCDPIGDVQKHKGRNIFAVFVGGGYVPVHFGQTGNQVFSCSVDSLCRFRDLHFRSRAGRRDPVAFYEHGPVGSYFFVRHGQGIDMLERDLGLGEAGGEYACNEHAHHRKV